MLSFTTQELSFYVFDFTKAADKSPTYFCFQLIKMFLYLISVLSARYPDILFILDNRYVFPYDSTILCAFLHFRQPPAVIPVYRCTTFVV